MEKEGSELETVSMQYLSELAAVRILAVQLAEGLKSGHSYLFLSILVDRILELNSKLSPIQIQPVALSLTAGGSQIRTKSNTKPDLDVLDRVEL